MTDFQHREIDLWIRRMAIIGPIVTFILGWGSGILTAAFMYRDHEKRIGQLESTVIQCREDRASMRQWIAKMETIHERGK